jgi:hypothetical protein
MLSDLEESGVYYVAQCTGVEDIPGVSTGSTDSTSGTNDASVSDTGVALISVFVPVGVLVLIGISYWTFFRQKKSLSTSSSTAENPMSGNL